jgi:TonB family protein
MGLATLISAAVHLLVLEAALHRAPMVLQSDPSEILPALYLYAPDRRPSVPRQFRLPVPAPPGLPEARGDDVIRAVLAEAPSTSVPETTHGLPLPGPDEVLFDSVFSAIAVDSEVVRYPSSTAPVYPDGLMKVGMEGLVEVEFVVDTTGQVDMTTVRILRSTHPEFQASVEAALAGMQFRPAWRGWRRVRQLVQQRFAFRLVRPPEPETQS